jgi:LMBR1 domain-containing protein 1
LNAYFKWFDQWFPLFGVISVAIFTVYLLIAAVKGCFKFGIRFMFFQIHPMKVNKTYMSSFLFNIGLVLLCALPVVQFCQMAFADYAAFSNIRQMFGVQVENLSFIGWFYRKFVFVYIFMAFCAMTTLYLFCKPRDTSADSLALKDRLKKRVGAGPGQAAQSMANAGRDRSSTAAARSTTTSISSNTMNTNSNTRSSNKAGSSKRASYSETVEF